MDTAGFTVYIKTEDIETYVEITKYVETNLDAWNYELDGPLPRGKNKILIGVKWWLVLLRCELKHIAV